jgi:calcineurin-binding protein cabin-1
LQNSLHLYNFFKLKTLPEYDSYSKKSIPTEFGEFITEVAKLFERERSEDGPIDVETDLETAENGEEEELFLNCLKSENFQSFNNLPQNQNDNNKFDDIYYLLADYNFKITKKDNLTTKYYIKDLILNRDRFDSWAALALTTSKQVLNSLENGLVTLKCSLDGKLFFDRVFIAINMFKRSIELRSTDDTIWIEYGSYLYQIHSFCSRQLKNNQILNIFEDEAIKTELKKKINFFLTLSNEAYIEANRISHITTSKDEQTNDNNTIQTQPPEIINSTKKKNNKNNNKTTRVDYEEGNIDEWLHHYMFGKIKEKQLKSDELRTLIECLQCYKNSIVCLEKSGASFLKRLNYKIKGNLSFESNEVIICSIFIEY